jgi:serine/threonine protein kinase
MTASPGTMSAAFEQQVLRLVGRALEIADDEREAFVVIACGDDTALQEAVRAQLRACELVQRDEDFLHGSAAEVVADVISQVEAESAKEPSLESVAAALTGRYRFIRELGRGGSAVVYLARDVRHDREVAIKLIQLGSGDRGQRSRFVREIAVVAKLRHSYIVSLIDSGEVEDAMYYVMPYMQGESLRDLLDREGALPLERVVSIVSEVAEALDYAHASGVVHRDIKPQNILLSTGHAHVSDFGIALALETTLSGRSTDAGIVIGTPAYMSPEQAIPGQPIDRRSDVYSLGCTVYEMLAGEVPFPGKDPRSVLAKHLQAPPPQLRILRPQAPLAVQRAVEVALAKIPADRYATAGAFAAALTAEKEVVEGESEVKQSSKSEPNGEHKSQSDDDGTDVAKRRRVVWWMAAIGAVAALSGFIATRAFTRLASKSALDGDTSQYLVLPVEQSKGASLELDAAQRLRESLRRWTGIRVVDQFTMRQQFADDSVMLQSDELLRSAALALGSARYIRTRVEGGRNNTRLVVTLFDVDKGQLAEVSDRIPSEAFAVDSVFDRVAERLLFHSVALDRATEPHIGTRSFPARYAFLRAHEYIKAWDLARADSALFVATDIDKQYFQAKLWLALVRLWREQPGARWRSEALQVSTNAALLSDRERRVSDALVALDSARFERACRAWETLASEKPSDALSWFSAGLCRRLDDGILPDATSPSGWRFRSSYRVALAHHERALRLMPAIYRGLRDNGFEQLRRLLKTSGTDLRSGRAVTPDSVAFVAYPSLRQDTLAFVPIKQTDLTTLAPAALEQLSPGVSQAVRRQRELFRDWATTWASNYPKSAEAWEAVAISLEGLGDASALDTIARAISFARDDAELRRIRGSEAWLLVKFSLPSNVSGLRRAREIANNLLREAPAHAGEARMLMSLAVLIGRIATAEQLASRVQTYPQANFASDLNRAASTLLLNAAMAGPNEKIGAAERQTDSLIRLTIATDSARRKAHSVTIGRAAPLAFSRYKMDALNTTATSANYLFNTYVAWHHGDAASVRQMIAMLRAARAKQSPADFTFDAQFPEAWLLSAVEGKRAAAAWLDPPLSFLRFSSYMGFLDPVRAASLVRAMAYRANLASDLGDSRTAAVWARAVLELWRDADPELREITQQMRHLLD